MSGKKKIVCLTPVKNEEWILREFLQATSIWADYIIIADQNSEDRSVEIARSFEKVIIISNSSTTFNEPERQKMLIEEARKIPGDKLLIALDADELLYMDQSDLIHWTPILALEKGSTIYFECANIDESFQQYWTKGYHFYGYVDDGADHHGLPIDSPRLPGNDFNPKITVDRMKVFHLQYINMRRARLMQLWYQCLEKTLESDITYLGTKKTNFYLFQRYNKLHFVQPNKLDVPASWFKFLDEAGILKLSKAQPESDYFFLRDIKAFFDRYGIRYFQNLNIWDYDWNSQFNSNNYSDPRCFHTRLIHKWLLSRPYMRFSRSELFLIKFLELIRLF
jgi:hypothetical protein